ncbi:MAG TPA: proprotein convertase P-domain-containing protein, partial [Thermoguttaceae bacterium]|nr:proprotein convertase P-domain-containing protein [Thermoguttaceae bacterium]
GGHAITVWGVASDGGELTGLWVTDSDDSKYLSNPTDQLRYYDVDYDNGRWYLQDFYGYGSRTWYIGAVEGLEQNPNREETAPPQPNAPANEIQGSVFNDANANGRKDAGEAGLAGQTVFLDANHNGVLDTAHLQRASADAARAIADLKTTTSTLTIGGTSGTIADLNITLDVSHTYTQDLEAYLIGPDGTRVLLFSNVGGGGSDLRGTTLDDQAARSISAAGAPFSGTFRPQGSLAEFAGKSADGTWTLEISDNYSDDEGTLLGWSLDLSTVEKSTVTAADGSYSFTDLSDDDYRVVIAMPDGWQQTLPAAGYHDVSLSGGETASLVDFGLGTSAVIALGVVDYGYLDELDWGAGQYHFSLEAAHNGYLTIEAGVSSAEAAGVTIYDDNGNAVATSTMVDGLQRVDYQVRAGQIFFVGIDVNGAATLNNLRLVNLVQQNGSTVTVHGTAGDDSLLFTAGAQHQITINQVHYAFAPAKAARVVFNGAAGADTAVLNGSAGKDTLVARPATATLTGTNYVVTINGTETVTVIGNGGDDRAKLYGSSGNDTLVGRPDRVELHGTNYSHYVEGFREVRAYAGAGGTDVATFHDSAGNDTFVGRSTYASLSGTNYINYAGGFCQTYAYATAGGTDVAKLYGSAGSDTFIGRPTDASLSGTNYFNHAAGFRQTYAYAAAGGTDVAKFYDSAGNDTFIGKPTVAYMEGTNYLNYAAGFRQTYAYATAGGNDVAKLYGSSGKDTFIGTPTTASLSGANYLNQAAGFRQTYAYAGAGGADVAKLQDSAGNDCLTANKRWAQLAYGDGKTMFIRDFAWVEARATAGGKNTKDIDPVDYVLQTQGSWINV